MDMKIIWINNDGYHSIRQTQANLFGSCFVGIDKASGISFPSAEKIAGAYGISYVCIDNADDADDKLREALAMPGPVIIEAIVDSNQFFEPKISSKVLPDGSIVSPPIHDMYPFLDRDEFEKNMLVEYE